MTFYALRTALKSNLFSLLDVYQLFNHEKPASVIIQLSRFVKKGLIKKIKQGLYCFDKDQVDQFILPSLLYSPSYISLETALNYYGLIPDIPQTITSVTPITTKKISNDFGTFHYAKITPRLFFGFTSIKSATTNSYYQIAVKEKAVLDYLYIRKISSLTSLRLNSHLLNSEILTKYAHYFPLWLQKVKIFI